MLIQIGTSKTRSDCVSAPSDQFRRYPLVPLVTVTGSRGPDQTVRLRSLIWIFAVLTCLEAFTILEEE